MKKILQLKLKLLAKLILRKYQPEIVGITGSIGKSSTKEAVFSVLSSRFNVRQNIKNYNNEIGLPLTIIGVESAGRSFLGWLGVFYKALRLIIKTDKSYPEILVLEMGIDRPGDMEYLTSIAQCQVGVVTMIGESHIEFFGTREKIQKEKGIMIKNMDNKGVAVLNYDNELSREIGEWSKARVMTYGLDPKADIRAAEIIFSYGSDKDRTLKGISFKLRQNGSAVPVFIPNVIGLPVVYASLAAVAVGMAFEMNLLEISQALASFVPPKGRLNIIPGIKGTTIIDDTYNSAPKSAITALEAVKDIEIGQGAKKYAVLGDMLELGDYTEKGHRDVGEAVVANGIHYLVVVGERSLHTKHAAIEAGMSEDDIFHFDDSASAGRFVQDRIKKGDLVLIKGSQGMRMEKCALELMAEPLKAKELLVRQDRLWEGR